MAKKAQRGRQEEASSKESRAVSVAFAPLLDLLGAVRDHGKLGELRAELQSADTVLILAASDVSALQTFVKNDPILSKHPVAASFADAPIGENGDLGFPFGR